jgi:hypothetical protein
MFWERYNVMWLFRESLTLTRPCLTAAVQPESYLVPPVQYFSIFYYTHLYVLSIMGPTVKSSPWLSCVEPEWIQNYTGSHVECPKWDTYCFSNWMFLSLREKVETYCFVGVLRKSRPKLLDSLNFQTSAIPVCSTTQLSHNNYSDYILSKHLATGFNIFF